MKHMKKTLILIAELEILALVLNYIFNIGLDYVGDSVEAQLFFLLPCAVVAALSIVYFFKWNFKGFTEKDFYVNKIALIVILCILANITFLKGWSYEFEKFMMERLGSLYGHYFAKVILLLPWELWVIYTIVSAYEDNRKAEKDEKEQ